MEKKKVCVITGASSGIGKEFFNSLSKDSDFKFDEIWVIARTDEKLKALHTLYKTDALITGLFPKVKSASRFCYDDVKSQHDFLFRPHFLRSGIFFEHYSRYLRGLKLRVERLTASPGKDELKMEQLEEYTERFSLAVEGVEISEHPVLEEFWHLLEEARLSVFAPEVPLAVRTPLKKLPDAWNNLRI